jgi:hypothetical protein
MLATHELQGLSWMFNNNGLSAVYEYPIHRTT